MGKCKSKIFVSFLAVLLFGVFGGSGCTFLKNIVENNGNSEYQQSSGSSEGATSDSTTKEEKPMEEKEYPIEEMTDITPDYAELWRPQYHYTTSDSWVNDPNGLVYYKGVWHMYYQLNPHVNVWGNLHWGHATSTDLVHWTEHDPALFPDQVGVMFSGTAVVDENNTSGFFTNTEDKQGIVAAYSTDTQHIGIAYSTDGYNFTKVSETEPVLERPLGVNDFRDPHIFWHEETNKWIMVVAGTELRIYSSPNLVDWTYCSLIKVNTECPSLLRMPVEGTNKEKWLLSCSGRGYYTGNFDGTTFEITSNYIPMNVGPDSYAGITFANAPDDRIVMLNWMNNWAYTLPEGKWNGAFTLPVEMTLKKVDHQYILFQNPVKEVEAVRSDRLLELENVECTGNPLANIKSNRFELNMEIDLAKSSDFDLLFCKGIGEETRISFSKQYKDITVNRSLSNYGFSDLKDKNNNYRFNVEEESIVDNTLKLRLFVDGSNMELYVNDGYYYFAGRIQPFTTSRAMKLVAADSIAIKKLTIDECGSIWFDELPSAVHLSSEKKIVLEEGQVKDDVAVGSLNGSLVKCKVDDESIVSAKIEDGYLTVTALKSGDTEIMVYCGKYYKKIKVKVTGEEGSGATEEEPVVGLLENMQLVGCAVTEEDDCVYLDNLGTGDAFAFSAKTISDARISAQVKLSEKGAASFLFRATDTNNFYCVNIDTWSGVVKFWKKVDGAVTDITAVGKTLDLDTYYTLTVEAIGESIKVYLDGELVIDTTDNSFATGCFGLNAWATDGYFKDLSVEDISSL